MLDAPTLGAWLQYSGWWLFRKSHMVHLAGKVLQPIWLSIRHTGRARAHIDMSTALTDLRVNAQANFVKMIERSALILRHDGVVPVFTLQPELVLKQAKVLSPLEQKIYRELDTEWQDNFVEYKNEARPIVTELARRAAEGTGAQFYDLTDIYGGVSGDVYTDYCHLTPLGNQRLAEYLGEQLLPTVRKRLIAGRAGTESPGRHEARGLAVAGHGGVAR
jgi:hypothetical protein